MANYAYTFTSGDVVTPTKLNDARTVSEIVNADIKSDAAIAGTKIAPDFGSQDVTASGKITLTKPAVSFSNITNTPAEFIRLGWQEATQDLGLGEGCAINFAASLVSDSGTFYPVASVASFKEDASDASRASSLNFFTSSNGTAAPTERMRIDSSGNVGIANVSPTEKLHVTGNIKASGYIDAGTSFRGQSSDSASTPSFTWTGDTDTGMFRPAGNTLAFCEGGAEAMRINSSGEVLIGTTTAIDTQSGSADGFTFNDSNLSASTNDASVMFLRRRSGNGAIVTFRRDTTTVGTISVTTTATAYNTSSDYRLKENPTPLIGGLATIDQLQPCEFTWKSDGSTGRGFIAHELQAVVPEAVTGEKDAVDAEGNPEYQGVDAAKLVPYLVSAVQELKTRVEALEAA
jgi:hypothetical protein